VKNVDKSKVIGNDARELSKKLMQNLRKENFKLGNLRNDYKPINRTTYQDVVSRPARLDPKLAKDLRAHHFGESMKNEYMTMN